MTADDPNKPTASANAAPTTDRPVVVLAGMGLIELRFMVCTCFAVADRATLVTVRDTSSEIHAKRKTSDKSRTWSESNGFA
jgi:hypothetical protein